MSFPYVWIAASIFSLKKVSSFAISIAPTSFFKQHISTVEFPLLFGWGSLVVVGGLFLFPESTRHRSQTAYLISREENPSLQLLLIRVKWSRPTNSCWTPEKPSLSFFLFLASSSVHFSVSGLKLDFWGWGGKEGPRCWGPPRTSSPLNWSRWKRVGKAAVGIDSCVLSEETGLDTYHNTLMGLCSIKPLAWGQQGPVTTLKSLLHGSSLWRRGLNNPLNNGEPQFCSLLFLLLYSCCIPLCIPILPHPA